MRLIGAWVVKNAPRTYWRGSKDLAVTAAFMAEGGTDHGCMSASTDRGVAVGFAVSKCPLVLRIEADNFMSRGANVAFLSVYPKEKEVLYPPLTYLQPIDSSSEWVNGALALIVRVRPTLGAK